MEHNHEQKNHQTHGCSVQSGHGNKGAHHGGGFASHGSAQDFLRRFWTVTVLLVPLILLMPPVITKLGWSDFTARPYISFGLATIIFYFGLVFFQHAWHEIKARQYGMMTLVSIAVGAGYLFSAVGTFWPELKTEFYIEIATLIWVLLFGHYLEAKSSTAAGDALGEVAKLLPRTARRKTGDKIEEVNIEELKEGEIVIVKTGEKIPADGEIIKGEGSLDESLISGESKPVEKLMGGKVVAGSLVADGVLEIKLNRVGNNSTVKQIEKLIAAAQKTKPSAQRLADRAAGWLTGIAILASLGTIAVWSIVVGESLVFSLTLGITVLVIACPHALGLAIPTVTTIGTTLAIKNGVFVKNMAKLEVIRGANYIVLDKTGTLTEGKFGVSRVISLYPEKISEAEIIKTAASLDVNSAHVISRAITEEAKKRKVILSEVSGFKNLSGRGVIGQAEGIDIYSGNLMLAKEQGEVEIRVKQKYEEISSEGETVIVVGREGKPIGLLALADRVRPESEEAIKKIHELGIKVAMLTGDNKSVARKVAGQLNLDTYFAEVLPEDKYKYIQKLQAEGNKVIMVGDGINDAPALAQADAGVAIGAGTEVAIEAGDVVLTRSNPMDIVRLVILSRKIYRKMIENLIWALGYNIIAIPAAAGVFAVWGVFLRPEIGALLMSLSSVIVVINALALKRVKLDVIA